MKTTWILGAGASISNSQGNFPSIDSIFSKAKELGITSQTTKSIKDEYKDVHSYIINEFGKNILRKDEKLDVEDLLTILEISISKSGKSKYIILYEKILKIIQEVFTKLHYNQELSSEYYKLLEKINDGDSIISFNWDLLLDDAFKRIYVLNENDPIHKTQYTNFYYNFTFRSDNSYSGMGIKDPYKNYNSENGIYLKLHGSIDWRTCNNKQCRAYGKIIPLLDYRNTHYCGECNKPVDILIIPPVLNKQYDNYPKISSLWTTASLELKQSDEVILWGYSLPPTDFYANWLIRQSKNSIKKVIIINPEIKRGSDIVTYNHVFLKRLLNPIKHKAREIVMYEYFNDYLENITIENKYGLLGYN